MTALHRVRDLGVLICFVLLVGCSNGRGNLDSPEAQETQEEFTVGGTVSGLAGSGLVLQNNGGSDLAVSAGGAFEFPGTLADGAAYDVTVLTQPSGPDQTCTVANGSGTIAGSNVSNIAITCSTGTFVVGGTLTGLEGSGLVLQNNGGDDLAIAADGSFTFATAVASGSPYDVTVATQPTNPSQSCTVENPSGTVGEADVTNIQVTCATGSFSIGGTVSGLLGSGLVLQNNDGDDLAINGNGSFVFAGKLASGAPYNVTVESQPTNPTQSCAVDNPSGTVSNADVTNVVVSCSTDQFTIGGTVSGLAGSGLVLQVNGRDDLLITVNGSFAFETAVPSGTGYVVSVKTQPSNPTQVCSVANAVGVVRDSNVNNVEVTCTTGSFSIGGTVSGLAGSGLVLQNNGRDDLPIASNGSFTFATQQASGTQYRVTIRTQPSNPSQTCTVANGGGTVGGGNVRNVRVTCSTSTFSVGGQVSGLLGSGLVLQNNGGDDLVVSANGAFTFQNELASGASYNVTARAQPSNPTQVCSVTNGTGVIGSADVTNVAVSCSTSDFTIGGQVSGLSGSGLVLRNNGADDLTIDSNGSFTFATPLPTGATYSVTIATQPTSPNQTCTVENGSGVVGQSNVTSVQVSCTTSEFTIGGQVSDLSGSGLVLQNNGADDLPIASNGSFTFATSLPNGASYNVTVASQPSDPDQSCTVENGLGVVAGEDVQNIEVRCSGNDDDD